MRQANAEERDHLAERHDFSHELIEKQSGQK
jgi:hypothetical protein